MFIAGDNVDQKMEIVPIDSLNSDTVVIGKGKAFLMGDNRKESYDSRHYGLIDWEEIIAPEL